MKKRKITYMTNFLILSLLLFNCSKSTPPIHAETGNNANDTEQANTIEWDQQSLVRVASPLAGKSYAGYARLIEIANGTLLCVYESGGNIMLVKSKDKGKSWGAASIVAEKETGINMAVPDILELKNGDLLLMYNPRPHDIDPSRHFAIRVKRSLDHGNTWEQTQEIYQAGYQFENGCWEPAAIQLPNGQIQLFFANEGIYTTSNEQNISMLRSDDQGASWSSTPEIISFRPGSRDGMPVPLLLRGGNRIAVAIEDNGFTNFKPYIISNTLAQNWAKTVGANSPDRVYAMAEHVQDQVYAGAPYLRQLSTGETILSYQGTEGRQGHSLEYAVMKVVVGNETAAEFGGKSEPFAIPQGKVGLWNSISVLQDDTIIALSSTNAYSTGATEVWMIKGKLKKP